jgi:hypothetical protein
LPIVRVSFELKINSVLGLYTEEELPAEFKLYLPIKGSQPVGEPSGESISTS